MIAGLLVGLAGAVEPPPAAPPPPALVSPTFDPRKEKYLERDRRSRGAYRVAATVGAVGITMEVIGGFSNSVELYRLGGTMEAVAIPTMAFTSLVSHYSLDKFTDTKPPIFGYVGSGAAALDLAASLAAAPDETVLTRQERRQLSVVALASRLVTLTSALLQQRQNNRVRTEVGLRVQRTQPFPVRRRPTVALSPWLGDRSAGILLSLSDAAGR